MGKKVHFETLGDQELVVAANGKRTMTRQRTAQPVPNKPCASCELKRDTRSIDGSGLWVAINSKVGSE